MNTTATTISPLAAGQAALSPTPTLAITHEEARALYTALCAKARRLFPRECSEGHILVSVVQAMSNEWDWSQGFLVSDLRALTPADRGAILRLIEYICTARYALSGFEAIHRAAFRDL